MKSKRIFMCVVGVMVCAVSVGFFKLAAFGVDPFQTCMSGLDQLIPIDFGTLYVLVNAALLLFSFSVNQFWPDGCEKLQDFLLPGEKTPTALAADRLLNRIRDGVGFEEALRTFCLEILKDADPV